jgi:hypothetical protein
VERWPEEVDGADRPVAAEGYTGSVDEPGCVMESPDLTLEEITAAGRPAHLILPLEEGSGYGEGVFREWLFDGERPVWVSYRDEIHTYSCRLVAEHDIPRTGWHHMSGCDCRFCAGARQRTSGVTRG